MASKLPDNLFPDYSSFTTEDLVNRLLVDPDKLDAALYLQNIADAEALIAAIYALPNPSADDLELLNQAKLEKSISLAALALLTNRLPRQ